MEIITSEPCEDNIGDISIMDSLIGDGVYTNIRIATFNLYTEDESIETDENGNPLFHDYKNASVSFSNGMYSISDNLDLIINAMKAMVRDLENINSSKESDGN